MNKIALVTGGSNGLGKLIGDELAGHGYEVVRYDKMNGNDVCDPRDLPDRIDVLVNNAGINKIDWLPHFRERDWDEVMETNVKGIFMMTQACLAALHASKGTVLNIVSNAARMPMRCSAAYNASKGAALILTKQLARELAPDITVFSMSPNRLKGTRMSASIDKQVVRTRGWTQELAENYQRSCMLTGEETDPAMVAELAGFLLSTKERHAYLAGCDIECGA